MDTNKIELNERMQEIAEFFKDLGRVYFVGGCIRDTLMGETPHDYDLITNKTPAEVTAYIQHKGRRAYQVGARFGTISCKVGADNEMVEITTFRSETYDFETRKPTVKFSEHLEEDLQRRDFTINAIACNMHGHIKDPLNGITDLQNKVLRAVGIPKHRFKEDPLRIIRAIRFAAKYNLEIEKVTKEKLEHCRWELLRLSKERIIDETNKILKLHESEAVKKALLNYWEFKIWQVIFPQMQLQWHYQQDNPHHHFTLHKHTLNVVANVKNEPILRNDLPCLWSVLLHDVGKPFTRENHKTQDYHTYINHDLLGSEIANDFCLKYKFSNDDRELIVKYIKEHIQPGNWMKPFDDAGKKNMDEYVNKIYKNSLLGHKGESK